jgi:hypothetical protein
VEESEAAEDGLTDSMEPAGHSYPIVVQLLERVFLNNNFGADQRGFWTEFDRGWRFWREL